MGRRGGASDNLETEFVSPRSSYGEDSLTASTTEISGHRVYRNKKEIHTNDVENSEIKRSKKNRKHKTKRVSPFSTPRVKVKQNGKSIEDSNEDTYGEKVSKSRGKIKNQNRKRKKGDKTNPKSWS